MRVRTCVAMYEFIVSVTATGVFHGLWVAPIAWLMASSVAATAQENPNPAEVRALPLFPRSALSRQHRWRRPRYAPCSGSRRRTHPCCDALPSPLRLPQKRVPGAVELDKIPSNVVTVGASAFDGTKAPDLLQSLDRALPGVSLSSQTGNDFQLDLNYRGYTASPVIGTPQGLAVYQNGVRINEVFGDVVNWDFIPQSAINQLTLVPSNPVYGLNATGGALAFEMKNGYTYHAVEGELSGGSYGRAVASVQAGGQTGNLSGYITADAINDAGWRNNSPSSLRRVYADLGARGDQTEFHVTFTGADNNFGAAAATPVQMLGQDWASTYTIPQTTQNQLAFLTASATWKPTDTWTYQALGLFSQLPSKPRGRQRHGRIERSNSVSRSDIAVLSQSRRLGVQPDHDPGTDCPQLGRAWVSECLGRNRSHLDQYQQFRRHRSGGNVRKDFRSQQQLHDRPERGSRPCAILINERIGNGQCQSVPDRAGLRVFHRPAVGRRSASGAGCEYTLYGPLRDRHVRRHVTLRRSLPAGASTSPKSI